MTKDFVDGTTKAITETTKDVVDNKRKEEPKGQFKKLKSIDVNESNKFTHKKG